MVTTTLFVAPNLELSLQFVGECGQASNQHEKLAFQSLGLVQQLVGPHPVHLAHRHH
jgi:hypothetical protein